MSSVLQLLRREQRSLHTSPSAIRTLEACPRQFWHRYVQGRPAERTSSRLVLGIGVHRALAHFYRSLAQSGSEPDRDELIGVAASHIAKSTAGDAPIIFPEGGSAEALVEEAISLVDVFLEQGFRPDKIVAVEHAFALELHHPYTGEGYGFEEAVVGSMDLVAHHKGRLLVVDHKVCGRRDRQKAERADVQMAIYSWAAKAIFGETVVDLAYQDLVSTKTPAVLLQHIGRHRGDELEAIELVVAGLRLVDVAVDAENGMSYFPRRRSWRCRDCGWATACDQMAEASPP